MKKFKYLILSAVTLCAMTACGGKGNGTSGELPKGGTVIDVTKPESAATLKSAVKNVVTKTYAQLDKIQLEAKLAETNISAKVSFDQAGFKELTKMDGAFNMEANVKGLSSTTTVAVEGLKGRVKDIKASAKEVLGGQVSVKGSMPMINAEESQKQGKEVYEQKSLDYSLEVKNAELNAYFDKCAVYVDASSSGLKSSLDNVTTMLGKVWSDFSLKAITEMDAPNINELLDSAIGKDRKVKMDLTETIGPASEMILLPELPQGFETQLDSYVDVFVGAMQQLAKTAENLYKGITIKTWDDGRFGVQLALDKNGLLDIVKLVVTDPASYTETKTMLDKYLKEFSFSVAVLADKDGLLSDISAGVKANLTAENDVRDDNGKAVGKGSVEASVESGLNLKLTYGQAVTLPSLEGYTPINFGA